MLILNSYIEFLYCILILNSCNQFLYWIQKYDFEEVQRTWPFLARGRDGKSRRWWACVRLELQQFRVDVGQELQHACAVQSLIERVALWRHRHVSVVAPRIIILMNRFLHWIDPKCPGHERPPGHLFVILARSQWAREWLAATFVQRANYARHEYDELWRRQDVLQRASRNHYFSRDWAKRVLETAADRAGFLVGIYQTKCKYFVCCLQMLSCAWADEATLFVADGATLH